MKQAQKGRVLREYSETVTFDVFGYDVEVVITNSFETSAEKRGVPDGAINPQAGAVTIEYTGRSAMLLPLRLEPDYVAHECSHALHNLMERVGATHEDEFVAYHLGYLVRRVHAAYADAKKHFRKAAEKQRQQRKRVGRKR